MDLTQLVKQTCQEVGMPALGAIVLRQDEIVDQAITGVRRLGSDTAVTPDDHFHIGSNTKAMTGTIAAMLVEAGQLNWDATIGDILPELQSTIHPDYAGITLQQLFTHRAGLPPFEEDEEFVDLPDFPADPVAQRREFAAWVLSQKPFLPPGSERRYSNAGFGVAAVMMEAVAGESWQSLMQHRLFDPLPMRAGFGWPAAQDPNQPWGHMDKEGQLVPHPPDDDYQLPPIIAPAGDVHVAFADYPAFLQMHLRGLRGDTTFLQPDTFRYLHTSHGGAGIGWGVQAFMDTPISVHTGSADTFFAIHLLAPALDMGLIIVTNAFSDAIEQGCIELLKALFSPYAAPD